MENSDYFDAGCSSLGENENARTKNTNKKQMNDK